jgi:hypothetical protein
LAAAVVIGSAQGARADLNLTGEVGLPINPTAQVPSQGGIRLQGDYWDVGDDVKFYGVHAAGRVGNAPLEISGGVSRLDFSSDDETGLDIGIKYLFTRESDPAGIRIAAGAGYSKALFKNKHAYIVASKYLGEVTGERVPIILHGGVRYDRFDFGDNADNESKVSAFIGTEIPVTRTGEWQLVGELGSKVVDGGETPYSASIRYRPQGKGFGASLGIARHGLGSDSGVFAQIGYTFDTGPSGTTAPAGQ